MEANSALRFLDFPFEIQQLVLRKCLEGWKATVEVHEKGDKITARLFSSIIYDALMLSLTCKSFHDTIQKIQSDPRLFSGEMDLIEANAQLSYLLGVFTKTVDPYFASMEPVPPYRTQIFIKNQPYNRSSQQWRIERAQYHANVRDWLLRNTTSIGVWADEITPSVPWDMFLNLQHVTLYWPNALFASKDPNLYMCEHSKEDLVEMVQEATNTDEEWHIRRIRAPVDLLTERGLTVTLYVETGHAHERGALVWSVHINDPANPNISKPRPFYNIACQVQVEGTEWRLDHVVCDDQRPFTFDDPDTSCFMMAIYEDE